MEKKKKSFSNARKKIKFRNCMWDRTPVPLHLCPTEEDSGLPATMIKVRCSHRSQRGRVKKTYFEVQTCHFFAMCHYVTPPQQDLVLPINDVIFRGNRCFQIS